MTDHLLLPILAGAIAAEQWWTRRRIRRWFAGRDMTVTRIRWLPLKPLASLRFRQMTSLYSVRYRDAQGRAFRCQFVSGFWDGFRAEDICPDDDAGACGPVSASAARSDESPFAAADGLRGAAGYYALALVLSALACLWMGLSYWSQPYGQLNLPDALYGFGLALVPAFSFALTRWQPRRVIGTLAIMTASVIAVIGIRAAQDLARDPTTHNLLGIEIAIGLVLGLVAAAAGIVLARILPRRDE